MAINSLCSGTSVLNRHHFQHIISIMSIGKLLIIKLALPENPHLNPPIGKDTNQSNKARLSDEPKSKLNRTQYTKKHPSDTPNYKGHRSRHQVQIGTPTRIESSEIGEQHSWEDNRSKRQPSTFLFINCINSRNL